MSGLRHDVSYALRQWRNAPGFTAAALLTIAIGIGANTAVFSVVDAVLLRKFPFPGQDRMVAVTAFLPKQNSTVVLDSVAQAWRSANGSFEALAAWRSGGAVLHGAGDPVRLRLARVTADFLPMLGVSARLAGENTVLLSHELWKTRFGSDPALVGQTISLDDAPTLVVGVLPAGFEFPTSGRIDALVPMGDPPPAIQGKRAVIMMEVIGRLKPGITPEMAALDLTLVTRRATEQFPPAYQRMMEGASPRVIPLVRHLAGDTRQVLWVFLGAVGLLLMIASANVANMLLGRTSARLKEVSLRLAIGADRIRIARQLLTESLVLAGGGALLGVALAVAGIVALRAAAPASVPNVANASLSVPVLLFTITVTIGTGLLFGMAPLSQVRQAHPGAALSVQASVPTRAGRRLDGALVACEVALAVMLLAGAGLLGRSFLNLITLDPGFEPSHLLTAGVQLPPLRYETKDQQRLYFDQMLARVRAVPGVVSADAVVTLPYQGFMMSAGIEIEGRSPADLGTNPGAALGMATPGCFRTLGMALVSGRAFDDGDQPGSTPVAIVNRAFLGKFFPDRTAVGKRIRIGEATWTEIVGVVADVRQRGIGSIPEPYVYRPFAQMPSSVAGLAVRTAGNPLDAMPAVREAARATDSAVLFQNFASMEQNMERLVAAQRFNMQVLAVFAMAGLMLAATGVYGVLSYSVTRRKHEIGVRMALGARRGDIVKAVLSRAFAMTAIGAVAGVAGAVAIMRALSSMLYGVQPSDPLTMGGVVGAVMVVAAAAAYWPSRRAASVIPREALQ